MSTDLVHTITTALSMTSKEVATLAEKRHDHVLRDIDNLLKTLTPDLGAGFSMAYEGDPTNGYRYFNLDRDAAYCLVAGYDANARMRIIKRWQELEGQQKPKTPGEALVEMAQNFLAHERALSEHGRQIADLAIQQTHTQAQVSALVHGEDYLTIVGWHRLNGISLDAAQASAIGYRVSRICRDRGIQIGSATHPLYGRVNSYPRELLDEILPLATDL